jgi:addiction module RelE/StbE family toxin
LLKIVWDQGFKRAYKKKIKNNDDLKKKFWSAVNTFSKNPFDPRVRTHKLTGKLKDLWAFSCSSDCRVIFKFLEKDEVLLIDIGSHAEVY